MVCNDILTMVLTFYGSVYIDEETLCVMEGCFVIAHTCAANCLRRNLSCQVAVPVQKLLPENGFPENHRPKNTR